MLDGLNDVGPEVKAKVLIESNCTNTDAFCIERTHTTHNAIMIQHMLVVIARHHAIYTGYRLKITMLRFVRCLVIACVLWMCAYNVGAQFTSVDPANSTARAQFIDEVNTFLSSNSSDPDRDRDIDLDPPTVAVNDTDSDDLSDIVQRYIDIVMPQRGPARP